jgi:Zn-dependent M28 family amino/carboxypeptidase
MWNTPGAYDNASGVCVLLEVARRLHARPASRPVDVVFFGAEEWNLAGSRAYVSALVDKGGLGEIDCVLVLDGFGRGSVLDVWVGPEAFEWEIARACASYASGRSVSIRFTSPPLPGSDHVPFWEEGTPAAMLTFNDQDVIHSSSDVPNEGSLANMVYAVGLVEYLVRHICLDWREDSSGIDG